MNSKTKQCKWEYNLWLDTIEHLQNENTCLNNHIAEIATAKLSQDELALVEVLMDKILENDFLLRNKRDEIYRMAYEYEVMGDNATVNRYLLLRHIEMRNDVAATELHIHTFKTFFCAELSGGV